MKNTHTHTAMATSKYQQLISYTSYQSPEVIGGEGVPQEGHMSQALPPPVGLQEVGVHGHTAVEHEKEGGAGDGTAAGLVDRDPQEAKGLHY